MERETWSKRSYFIFAALGSAIGLGNLWSFLIFLINMVESFLNSLYNKFIFNGYPG